MLATEAPFPHFFDLEGNPLNGGSLFFGVANQNPETSQITVYWDAAGTQPAAQPISTLNGYPVRNGTPAIIYANSDYSMTVKDLRGSLIFYAASAVAASNAAALQATGGAALVGYDGGTVQDIADGAKLMASYTALRAYTGRATGVRITTQGISGHFYRDDADVTSADNGGTIIIDASSRRWKRLYDGPFDAKWFGAVGNGTADDTAAIQAVLDVVNAANGGAIFLPAGTYKVTAALNITGIDNLLFYGAGDDASIIRSTSATADVFFDSGTSWFRTFRDFSIESSVTRTDGNYFNLAGERRGLFDRIRITGHFNGFNFVGFEQTEMRSCSITKPSGAGTGIICGTAGAAGQGANLLINSCFIRGQNDVTQTDTLGLYGIAIYDVDAVWGVNTDIGAFLTSDMLISPNTRSANHFFTQCFFDATKNSNCLTIQGAGTKQQIAFHGSWFASGGKLTGGSVEACGVRASNTGSYQDVQFNGCKFYNNSGSGVLLEMPGADFNFSGCDWYANGISAATNRYGFWWIPATTGTVGPSISGSRFGGGNAPNDVRFDTNARAYSLVGCNLSSGVSNAGANGVFSGNINATDGDVASSATITVSPTQTYVNVTGTTNIGGITATYPGHIITLRFNGVLTVVDDSSNIRLAGNFTTAANSTLTLICDGAEWREIARANT